MSVLSHLERLDHKFAGSPEAEYVFEARKWRLRLAVAVLMTFVSLVIALASTAPLAGWLLVAFAIATGAKNVQMKRAWQRTVNVTAGRWYER